jgi:hypothetical protein
MGVYLLSRYIATAVSSIFHVKIFFVDVVKLLETNSNHQHLDTLSDGPSPLLNVQESETFLF